MTQQKHTRMQKHTRIRLLGALAAAMQKHTRIRLLGALAAAGLALAALAPSASAAGPRWQLASSADTSAPAGGTITYDVFLRNVGDAGVDPAVEPIELSGSLPPGLSLVSAEPLQGNFSWDCSTAKPGSRAFHCSIEEIVTPANLDQLIVKAAVEPGLPDPSVLTAHFAVSGGGAPAASTPDPTTITAAPPAFGVDAFDFGFEDREGNSFSRAAGHPYAFTTGLDLDTTTVPLPTKGELWPVEPARDIVTKLPPGFIGNPQAAAHCTEAQLNSDVLTFLPHCPAASQVGTVVLHVNGSGGEPITLPNPLYNMIPPPGSPARFAFNAAGVIVNLDTHLRSHSDYGINVDIDGISEGLPFDGGVVTLWDEPGGAGHDGERACPGENLPPFGPTCAGSPGPAFLRLPTSCGGPLPFSTEADSWWNPGRFDAFGEPDLTDPAWSARTIHTHQAPGYPANPADPETPWGAEQGLGSCDRVPVAGDLAARPTALETETSSGLEVHLEVPNPGLENPEGTSSSDLKDVTTALPRGVTINPSEAEGLGVCSRARYESSELSFHPDPSRGCPSDSKIGTVQVRTPLLEEAVPGDVYVAKPYENPFGSLLALYIVLEEPQRGIFIKLAGELRLNEETGRIEAEFDDLPQVPFSSFDLKLREGARAPLVTPSTCGAYKTETKIEGWSDPGHPIESDSSFEVTKGIGGGPCPPGGTPGFRPLFSAGSINNNAASFTPFDMRIQRSDGEQDMTRFSAVLPPGVLGRLAGVAECPEAAIAAAKAKSGLEEIAHPSCPAGSKIGRTTVGAGVGPVLTYVPGEVYLGGPFHGDPLSVIAITPVVAGPFDVGTVAVHEALTLNPRTAEVEVDGSASDPIPHILKGIPAKLRDLRVYVDRPDFIINPTSCDPSSARATLFGGGGDPFSTADDVPVALADRFQAASCASLGFKPRLGLKLRGGTRRGGHPGLRATYLPRKGDANIKGLVVRLPRSAFLDQAHIKTICTRVQFAAGAGNGAGCPGASRYGYIKAWTPLLEAPLEGPVFLRSSNHKLPDLVFALHGLVDIEVGVRIDSQNGGIRASLENSPDAPLSKVFLRMQGGEKSLIVNSRNLCGSVNRADLLFEGHNGKVAKARPEMRADCGRSGHGKHGRHSR